MTGQESRGRYERVPLGRVLETLPVGRTLQQGWSPQCSSEPAADESWGVLKTTAIQPGRFLDEHNKALPGHLEPRPALEVRPGDLLLTNAGPRARCAIPCLVRSTRPRLMLSGKVYRFRADPGLMDSRFLELYLLSAEAQADLDSRKTGISDSGLNLTRDRFLEMQVPCPSVSEQQRIVEMLEDHLSGLDAAKGLLARSIDRLRPLELLELQRSMDQSGVSEVPLSAFVERVEAGRSFGGSAPPAKADEWGIVRVSAMTWGAFRPGENKAVPAAAVDPRFEIKPGDLLVSRANTTAYVGAAVLVGETRPKLLLSDKSLRVVARPGIDTRWLLAALTSPRARTQISALATGTKDSMRNITQANLLGVRLPDEGADGRTRVVQARDQSAERGAKLATELEITAAKVKSLRRSLLAAAFSGRLTSTVTTDKLEEMARV